MGDAHVTTDGFAHPQSAPPPETPPEPPGRRTSRWWRLALAAMLGPGLVVMLADTDAGSLITAAQSGRRWGYAM